MIVVGDAAELPLADRSVQCVVTSPPYWGLRKYAGEQAFIWTHADGTEWTGALGLEPTPELYVQHLVQVFAEVWRVLRDDGTVWLNLGDCSAHGGRGGNPVGSPHQKQRTNAGSLTQSRVPPNGFKEKDLIGIPWLAAFALRAAGWYLRDEIIWAKAHEFCPSGVVGSTMPESVTDRCTRAHEKLFLLTKAPRYYFDIAAGSQPGVYPSGTMAAKGSGTREGNRRGPKYPRAQGNGKPGRTDEEGYFTYTGARQLRNVWHISPRPYKEAHFATFPPQLVEPCVKMGSRPGDLILDPFSGSGTTVMVAARLGRRGIGVDVSLEYARLAVRRLTAAEPAAAGLGPAGSSAPHPPDSSPTESVPAHSPAASQGPARP